MMHRPQPESKDYPAQIGTPAVFHDPQVAADLARVWRQALARGPVVLDPDCALLANVNHLCRDAQGAPLQPGGSCAS